MADRSPREDLRTSGHEWPSVPDIVTDLAADVALPVIPPPVRRNLLKAFGQLCSAAIDFPVAYLAGMADERRAETAARIKLINTSAAQIAEQMRTNPAYARVAVEKFGQRVLREQVNLDMISQRTVRELSDTSSTTSNSKSGDPDDSIDDDWINAFESEARQKSTEEMQVYFARVLAGEVRRPGSYSTRTVKILGSLDKKVAECFLRLCSMSISSRFDNTRVSSLGGDANSNALKEYGLSFATLNLLNEHGLIIADYNSWWEFVPCIAFPGAERQVICTPLRYAGKYWTLLPVSKSSIGQTLRIHGVQLTQAGSELLEVVDIEAVQSYSGKLCRWFESNGYSMTEVQSDEQRIVDVSSVPG